MHELFFTKTHEWVKFLDEENALVGLTEFAQKELGDLVFVNLCEAGDLVEIGKAFGDVESVKAVSDVYAPVTGVVVKINEALLTEPELINADAMNTWLIEVERISDREEMLTLEEYEAFLKEGK